MLLTLQLKLQPDPHSIRRLRLMTILMITLTGLIQSSTQSIGSSSSSLPRLPPHHQHLKRQSTLIPALLSNPLATFESVLTNPSKASDSSKTPSSLTSPDVPVPINPSSNSTSNSNHDLNSNSNHDSTPIPDPSSTTPTPTTLDPAAPSLNPSPLPSPASQPIAAQSQPASISVSAPSSSPSPVLSSKPSTQTDVPISKTSNSNPKPNSSSSDPQNSQSNFNSSSNATNPNNTPATSSSPKQAAKKSGDDGGSSFGATTLKTIAIIAGVVSGIYILWTVIRKWKFSPSKRFAKKLDEYDDQVFAPRPPSFRENRANEYYTPYQSPPQPAQTAFGNPYPSYMQEETLAGVHGGDPYRAHPGGSPTADGAEHVGGYSYGPEHHAYAMRMSNSSLTTPSPVFESNVHRLSSAAPGNIQQSHLPYGYPPTIDLTPSKHS